MPDTTNNSIAAAQPAPNRAAPPRIRAVLGIVQTLIAYGNNLAETLEYHASVPHLLPCFRLIASIFASRDIALILARIKRGLLHPPCSRNGSKSAPPEAA